MPTAFKDILEEIASTVRRIKEDGEIRNDISKEIVSSMLKSNISNVVTKSFFRSQYVISNKNFTIVYLDDNLYIKPHNLNVGGFYNLNGVNDLIEKSLKHIFVLAHPSKKYGERSFTNDMAVTAIGNLISKYLPNKKHELFLIDK